MKQTAMRQTPMKLHGLALQSGQAVVESVLLLLILIIFFVAIHWLACIGDMALTSTQWSRYAAFQSTQDPDFDPSPLAATFVSGSSNHWRDRKGEKLLNAQAIALDIDRSQPLLSEAQPGGRLQTAEQLRSEWHLADTGIATARVQLQPHYQVLSHNQNALSPQLQVFAQQHIGITRHTAILNRAGHSQSDEQAHQKTAQSQHAWLAAYQPSHTIATKVNHIVAPVDHAWQRPALRFDWLSGWASKLPQMHLKRQPGHANPGP
ncbi:hypothetical protein [Brackiella oedipodis]|uniref:hypothetical protein n=1 Tax=Brackiella oedipodis TaxID=124225 RepID=UPI0006887A2B|nr:hypothetical protein [Brackiella oedipodis]